MADLGPEPEIEVFFSQTRYTSILRARFSREPGPGRRGVSYHVCGWSGCVSIWHNFRYKSQMALIGQLLT